eukprot:CAMPEP_0197291736 /NCGR_PEP_ID=MMETSP0890-20130614/18524_1 /TAXON_ID=44058 ORGANISM="Aureoumbra lagunensis, Strain CCMP1510" /NCGR_SAMPLE_ID=MMETSP0890 /ASSEMBLY_ACC=CAM_ASM_000533 /LENGTH=532 /DNA_ID=CAMNT_0042765053 /DNA_START=97 /DNA_END=1695 /DNA_ORIENTATION=+
MTQKHSIKFENPNDEKKAASFKKTGDSALALRYAAISANRAGRKRDAIGLLERATNLRPADEPRAWGLLAKLREEIGDVSGARATLRRSLQYFPENAELWRRLAEIAKRSNRFDTARLHYARAIRADSTFVAAWDAWSRMELSQNRPRAAAVLAKRGLDRVPKAESARLWHAYAMALNRWISPERPQKFALLQAEAALKQGLAVTPRHAHLLHAMGLQIYTMRQNAQETRRYLTAALERGQPEASLSLARLEENEGRVAAARAAYRRATHDKASVAAWRSAARFELLNGNRKEALDLFRKASVRFPRDVELHVQWARALEDNNVAREVLNTALRASPSSTRLYHALGELEAVHAVQCTHVEDQLKGLHSARRYFYKGAFRAPKRGPHLVALLFAWAHCEWAVALRTGFSSVAASRIRRLFAWAAKLSSRQSSPGYILLARAHFEFYGANNSRAAKRFVVAAIRAYQASDLPVPARAWTLLAQLSSGQLHTIFQARATAANNQILNQPLGHPLKRTWTQQPPPPEIRFGCVED